MDVSANTVVLNRVIPSFRGYLAISAEMFVVTIGHRGDRYWRLEGRDQGCCYVFYNTKGSPLLQSITLLKMSAGSKVKKILFYHVLNVNSMQDGACRCSLLYIQYLDHCTVHTWLPNNGMRKEFIHYSPCFYLHSWALVLFLAKLLCQPLIVLSVSMLPGLFLTHLYISRAWKVVGAQ